MMQHRITIEPIDAAQRQQVIRATEEYIVRAGDIFQRVFEPIDIYFDLIGRAAGMYRIKKAVKQIRYNPYLFAKYYADNLATTVPHEVAHYIVHQVYGNRRVQPHGKEWRALMHSFEANSSRTCDYDLAGIPVRRQHFHAYHCGCPMRHELGSRRHQRASSGRAYYICRCCGTRLVPALAA